MKRIAIAIDGPAASGKSTTAQLVARRLGFLHIDTGAMYRAMTLKVLDRGLDIGDRDHVEALAHETTIVLVSHEGANLVFLDGLDVTSRIRSRQVTAAVSAVSSYPGVREVMVREQRRMSESGGVVLEGRDIGTVVLQDAELKVFMIADVAERARRRKQDLALSGIDATETELRAELEARDRKDSTRAASPLRKADDAVELDTSNLTIDEQVAFIVERAERLMEQE